MALRPLQAMNPFGVFDGYDTEYKTLKGGEVVTLAAINVGTDLASADANGADGYVGLVTRKRPAITKNLVSGNRPLFLADEGIAGYGTLFGQVVGGVAGQVTNGTVLGPHTAEGSGKVTVWNFPGTYAVTLDAVDTSVNGVVPTNTNISVSTPLYATATGLLTTAAGSRFENIVVARFVEFSTNGSLVTSPKFLVSASGPTASFTEAVILWTVES